MDENKRGTACRDALNRPKARHIGGIDQCIARFHTRCLDRKNKWNIDINIEIKHTKLPNRGLEWQPARCQEWIERLFNTQAEVLQSVFLGHRREACVVHPNLFARKRPIDTYNKKRRTHSNVFLPGILDMRLDTRHPFRSERLCQVEKMVLVV